MWTLLPKPINPIDFSSCSLFQIQTHPWPLSLSRNNATNADARFDRIRCWQMFFPAASDLDGLGCIGFDIGPDHGYRGLKGSLIAIRETYVAAFGRDRMRNGQTWASCGQPWVPLQPGQGHHRSHQRDQLSTGILLITLISSNSLSLVWDSWVRLV